MPIHTEIRDKLGILFLSNPGKKNALIYQDRLDITDQLQRWAEDPAVRAVVLAGEGGDFCSGADVGAMGERDLAASRMRMHALQRMVLAAYQLEKPVVAAVRGVAVGLGWSLVLACDAKIVGESARFSQAFGRIAYAPDGGSAWFLTRELGTTRAKDIIYSSRMLGAREALDLGLVNTVVPDDQVFEAALAHAGSLASLAPYTFALTKRMVHATHAPGLESFLEIERLTQPQLAQTEDHQEAVRAFREKRPPNFTGR